MCIRDRYTTIVCPEGFVNVATLIVIFVHVWVEFAKTIAGWTSEETFDDVAAHVVEIIAIVVKNTAPVV